MNALTSTRSPIVIVPCDHAVARHMISVDRPTAMIALCPMLSSDSDASGSIAAAS